ncbi:hypothetical protein NHX12_023180 [Muraenolepis orangiensis]|uniref:Uncharacterized protein n=1 Tax=Muraenolepis orangiensis TaxID=630683 RepID=A0A9Q0IRT9_9TELE|nr:hypothetical protein NHX12_023180 [Muraenolepis orangiensis]
MESRTAGAGQANRFIDHFEGIIRRAAASKDIPMPPPLPSVRADDMLWDFFKPCSSSRRPTLFPPIQPFLTVATEAAFANGSGVKGWTTVEARGIPRLESSLILCLCPIKEWWQPT